MKRFLTAMLALILCLSAALAEEDRAAEELPVSETQKVAESTAAEPTPPPAAPEQKSAPEPESEEKTEPEPEVTPKPEAAEGTEADAEPAPDAEGDTPVIDDMMFPEDARPLITTVPDLPENAEGYIEKGGERVSGTLKELLAEAGKKTVYVSAKEPVRIAEFKLALLRDVKFRPDPEVFGKRHIVTLTFDDEALDAEIIDAAEDEEGTLVVSVEKKEQKPEEDPKEEPEEDIKVALKVTPRNYADGAWQCESPSFLLEGIPSEAEGYSYAAIIYDERIVPLGGDEYFAQEEGEYVVRFAVLDALGDVADKSEKYALKLDFTAPELAVEISAELDYTMTLSAADSLSGVMELSLDGGENWVPLNEGESVVHTESRKKVFAPGTIQVRDQAGNVIANDEEVVLNKIPRESAMGGWGGGGGGGASATAAPHASGDGDTAPYDAYELALPEGAVDVLTLGGEEIDLGLEIDSEDVPAEEAALFTAELTAWAVEAPADAEYAPSEDTLVVRAQVGDVTGPYSCTWRINGAVLRKLYNTDIRYLVLAAGDAALSLPTVGFTAGTRYAELKMEGMSTAEFEYEIVMRIDPDAEGPATDAEGWNLIARCAPEIHVEVAGERFDMIDRVTTPEMYPFDVYCGPANLPEYPYGAYPRAEVEVVS